MNLSTVVSTLDLDQEAEAVFAETWEEAERTRPSGEIPFLKPEFVAKACQDVSLTEEMTVVALRTARRSQESEMLKALAWHGHYCLFRPEKYNVRDLRRWPLLHKLLQEDAAMFYVLVTLSGLPQLLTYYKERNIPADVVRETLQDVPLKIVQHHRLEGELGISPGKIAWLTFHFWGKLFQLGRLQYAMDPFRGVIRVFRHKKTGQVAALSEEGMHYRADGRLNGAGNHRDNVGGWVARLEIDEKAIVGHPIAPTGYAFSSPISLATAEWEQILAKGDPVLQLHIPEAGPMDFELCGQSYQAATEFFPRYFPEHKFVAIACTSWILDSVFESILPAKSNLVRHMQEMYLYPASGTPNTCFGWVFGKAPEDLTKAPRDTSLRRAILDHLLAGGELRSGSSLLFPEHVKYWGTQYYRNQPLPWN